MPVTHADILTIRKMINAAIVFEDCNAIVDFKMLESIFFIIARHMNILERHVKVPMRKTVRSKKGISVTEIKIHAKTGKRSKSASTKNKHLRKTQSGESSDTVASEIKIHAKTRKRSKSASARNKSSRKTRSGESSDTADDQYKKKKTRPRSRSRSHSKKHFRDTSPTVFYTSKEKKKGKPGTKSKPRGSDDDESMDVLREKLLVDHRDSIVTEVQFEKMVDEVRKLQAKFGVKDMFADSDTPWAKRETSISLTDPRAALNMSERLDAAEKKVNEMMKVINKFASHVAGTDAKSVFKGGLFSQTQLTESRTKSGDPATVVKDTGGVPVDEEVLIATTEFEGQTILVTWQQLNEGLKKIRNDLLRDVHGEALNVTGTATKANKLFQQSEPKVLEALILNRKLEKTELQADNFISKVTLLDNNLTLQIADCQECVSQLQFDLNTTLERIEDACSHPKEDPNAVAAIKEDFESLQARFSVTHSEQTDLAALHKLNAYALDGLWKTITILRNDKTTREEVIEALKDKVTMQDRNTLLATEEFLAVVKYLQNHILITNNQIVSGETLWQKLIDDVTLHLHDKANFDQMDSLNHSLYMCMRTLNEKLNKMLDIVGLFPVNVYKKKLDRYGNCLSCGTPADEKLKKNYMKIAQRLLSRPVELSPKVDKSDIKHPCIPGLPKPHSLDPRSQYCENYCGASVHKSESSRQSPFGLDILELKPAQI